MVGPVAWGFLYAKNVVGSMMHRLWGLELFNALYNFVEEVLHGSSDSKGYVLIFHSLVSISEDS